MVMLNNGSQVTTRPTRKTTSGTPGYFTESDENVASSYPGQDWFNDMIDEFLNMLAEMEIPYEPDQVNYLATALASLKNASSITSGTFDPARLPAATPSAQGAVKLATNTDATSGNGSGILSATQLKTALDQFGLFGHSYELGTITDNSALDSAPHGAISFASTLPVASTTAVAYQGVKIASTDGTYAIIAGSNDSDSPTLVFYHATSGLWSTIPLINSLTFIEDTNYRIQIHPNGTCDISMLAYAGSNGTTYENTLPITIKPFTYTDGDTITATHYGGVQSVNIIVDAAKQSQATDSLFLRSTYTSDVRVLVQIKARVAS
jgi:hypothetical protein